MPPQPLKMVSPAPAPMVVSVMLTWIAVANPPPYTSRVSPMSPPPSTRISKLTKLTSPFSPRRVTGSTFELMMMRSAPPSEKMLSVENEPRVYEVVFVPSNTWMMFELFGSSETVMMSLPAVPAMVRIVGVATVVEMSSICQMPRPPVPAISRWLLNTCKSCTTVFGSERPYSDQLPPVQTVAVESRKTPPRPPANRVRSPATAAPAFVSNTASERISVVRRPGPAVPSAVTGPMRLSLMSRNVNPKSFDSRILFPWTTKMWV